jgi:hypothetical protein
VALHAKVGNDPVGTTMVNLMVAAPGTGLRVVNMSARAFVGTGHDILIPGIVVGGSAPRRFLIRGVGPTLGDYGVTGALADPMLTLVQQGTALATSDNWGASGNADVIAATADDLYAFPLPRNGKDAVLLTTLAPGTYSTKLEGVAAATGVGLVEVYDADDAGGGGELLNISARALVRGGDDVLIPGIVLEGGGSRRLLVRAVGLTLESYGVTGALPDPELHLYKGDTVLAGNDDWHASHDAAELRSVAASVYAFPLPEGSRDAAILATLPQGAYTMHVSGKGGASGVALVEVYVVNAASP